MKAVERNPSAAHDQPVERQSAGSHAAMDVSAARHGFAMEKMLLQRSRLDRALAHC
jgi:hypothetical protein